MHPEEPIIIMIAGSAFTDRLLSQVCLVSQLKSLSFCQSVRVHVCVCVCVRACVCPPPEAINN